MSRDIILKVDVYVCNYENVLDRLGWRQNVSEGLQKVKSNHFI